MKRNLFFPYLLACDPDASRFLEILELTSRYADTIEIGVPFSDPVADGPILAKASYELLSRGFQLESLFSILLRARIRVPLALMSYANPILAFDRSEFFSACRQSGIGSVIVPDVPFEEASEWQAAAREHGLHWIYFVSLQTRRDRLQRIAQNAEGFLYLLAVTGITGSRIRQREEVQRQATEIKRHTSVPIALGFGIRSPSDVVPYRDRVDAFIVGSKINELIHSNDINLLEKFYREMTGAIHSGGD